jgi:hypothetical protein
LYDKAIWLIDALRADPELPAEVTSVLDYHEGRTRIDEASRSGDLVRKREFFWTRRATGSRPSSWNNVIIR